MTSAANPAHTAPSCSGSTGPRRPTVPWWMLKLTTRTARASHADLPEVPGAPGAERQTRGMADALFPTAVPADAGWHRYTAASPTTGETGSVVVYGTELPTESELKLLGTVEGARILDLGCGTGRNAVALAQAGAKV